MAVYENYLYVGTSKGNVFLFDKESAHSLFFVGSLQLERTPLVQVRALFLFSFLGPWLFRRGGEMVVGTS